MNIFIIIFVVFLIIFSLGGCSTPNEVSQWTDYYKELAEQCMGKTSYSCCMSSVRSMEQGDYKIEPETGCPDGFQRNMLKCESSFKWCEPCALEGETIGADGMPERCCSGFKPMGGWPGGFEGNCSIPPPPHGLNICSDCGNKVCDVDNGENKCNCAEDCNV